MKMRWKEEMGEEGDFVKRLLEILEKKCLVWYKWHKAIYSGKELVSNDMLFQGEIDNGINFCKAFK